MLAAWLSAPATSSTACARGVSRGRARPSHAAGRRHPTTTNPSPNPNCSLTQAARTPTVLPNPSRSPGLTRAVLDDFAQLAQLMLAKLTVSGADAHGARGRALAAWCGAVRSPRISNPPAPSHPHPPHTPPYLPTSRRGVGPRGARLRGCDLLSDDEAAALCFLRADPRLALLRADARPRARHPRPHRRRLRRRRRRRRRRRGGGGGNGGGGHVVPIEPAMMLAAGCPEALHSRAHARRPAAPSEAGCAPGCAGWLGRVRGRLTAEGAPCRGRPGER